MRPGYPHRWQPERPDSPPPRRPVLLPKQLLRVRQHPKPESLQTFGTPLRQRTSEQGLEPGTCASLSPSYPRDQTFTVEFGARILYVIPDFKVATHRIQPILSAGPNLRASDFALPAIGCKDQCPIRCR